MPKFETLFNRHWTWRSVLHLSSIRTHTLFPWNIAHCFDGAIWEHNYATLLTMTIGYHSNAKLLIHIRSKRPYRRQRLKVLHLYPPLYRDPTLKKKKIVGSVQYPHDTQPNIATIYGSGQRRDVILHQQNFLLCFFYFCFEEILNVSFELDFEPSWMKLLLVISLRITFWCFPLVMYILLVPFGMKNLKCGKRKKELASQENQNQPVS